MLLLVLWLQALYYLATGLWPILHIDSFFAVTGPKEEVWLVKSFGALILPIGLTLLVSAVRRHIAGEILLLAAGSAIVLFLIDCISVFTRAIPPVYLVDAAAELLLLLGLLIGKIRSSSKVEWHNHSPT